MPASLKLTELIAEAAKQQVKIVAASPDGNFISINECSEKFFKTVKNVYLVGCEKHKFAYSIDDPSAGKISTATLYRRMEKSQCFCALCLREQSQVTKAVGHLGARVYQAIRSHPMASKIECFQIPDRSSMTDKELKLNLCCVECSKPHTKTVADVVNGDRLKHGFAVCKSCSCVMSTEHWKYTLEDLQRAAAVRGIKLLSVKTRQQGQLVPGRDNLATKVSSGYNCAVTCEYTGHQKRWQKTVNASTLLYGATGCPYCAAVINHVEMIAYAIVSQFVSEAEIEIFARPHWLERMHLDLYLEKFKLAIEIDGAHHSDPNEYYFNPKNHERDARKNQLLEEHGIQLIRIDLKPIKSALASCSGRKKVATAISHFLPILTKAAPDVFAAKDKIAKSKEGFKKAVYDCYAKLNRELVPNVYARKKRAFFEFCDKVGITVVGEYVNDFFEIEVWCPHEHTRKRRPVDIMAGMGQHCCRVSAKGTKASVLRAAELAADQGYLIDFKRSSADLNDGSIRATTKFSIVCPCGQNHSDSASIKALQGGRYKTCECFTSSDAILASYKQLGSKWIYDNNRLNSLIKPATNARQLKNERKVEGEYRLLELTLANRLLNRQKVLELLEKEGFDSTDDRIRKIWKALKMRSKNRYMKPKPLAYYRQKLKHFHQTEDAGRPLIY